MVKTKKVVTASGLTLKAYQEQVALTDEKKRTIISLLGLVGEIGDLQSIFKKGLLSNRYPTFRDDLSEELGDILWYVSSLASLQRLSLEKIAAKNLLKAGQIFDAGTNANFDKNYPPDERFPRHLSIKFEEIKVKKSIQVKIQINGVFVGDVLDDNAHSNDGYRFHDVFHLAYAAVLGWSPVLRSMLRRKRKSDSQIDRVEDGARARFVEEAISVFIFNQAKPREYFKDLNSIDLGLLKTVKRLTENLEVKVCTAKQWQQAIHQGYAMFHLLKENKGGIVHLDLNARRVSFEPLAKKSKGGKSNA